jgi:membrane protein
VTASGRPKGTPSDLARGSWRAAIKRTLAEFKDDDLTDRAAALTYYGVLSIFPAMLVVVSAVGLAGRSASQSLIDNLTDLAPSQVRDVLVTALQQLQGSRGGAGLVAALGLLTALWSASGYVGAFMRASNAVYDVPEGRPTWKILPIRLAITVVTLLLLAAAAVAVTAWGIAKWPVLFLIAAFLVSLLYWAAPNAKHGFRWVTPGGVLAIVLWLLASGGFALYVAGFASYNKTYGSLAGVIVFLVWLWLSNLAILLGAELNAELERSRAIEAGLPEDREPYVEPRDTRAL